MHISWLGHSAFKIETKTPWRDEVVILINPYLEPKADLPRNLKSDLVLLGSGEKNTITLSGEPFVISTPGEYEVRGVMVYAINISKNPKEPQLVFHFDTENVSTVFFGNFRGAVDEEMVDKLGLIDILLLPCGSGNVLSANEASDLVNQLEPRIVVPHSFNPPNGKLPFEPVDKFAKLLGQKEKEWLPKFKVSKRDLPQDETRLVLLEKT